MHTLIKTLSKFKDFNRKSKRDGMERIHTVQCPNVHQISNVQIFY